MLVVVVRVCWCTACSVGGVVTQNSKMQKKTMHRKENELCVSSVTSVPRIQDRILLVHSSGVRFEYSIRFLY